GDQVVVVAVEAAEGVDHGGVDGVGVEAFGVAGVAVVAGAGEAGVVAVGLAATMGAGADHGFAAFGAAESPGEQVVAAGGGAVGVVLAAGIEDGLGLLPRLGGDDRFVGAVARQTLWLRGYVGS